MTWKERFDDVFMSGNYHGRKGRVTRLAQLIYRDKRNEPKEFAVYEALEQYEAMCGDWFDPTRDELEEIVAEVY